MEISETFEPEWIETEKEELKKEFELDYENNSYKLKIEIEKNQKNLIFEIKLISEISFYIFEKKYKYERIIKDFNLQANEFKNIIKIYELIKEFEIINKNDDYIKLKVNKKYEVLVEKRKNDNIIENLVNKMNELIRENNDKEKRIKILENEVKKLKENKNIEQKVEIKNESFNLKKSVKDSVIIEKIFSYINIENQLKIIKYNKSYQKQLNLTIQKFKQISGKYIIGKETE